MMLLKQSTAAKIEFFMRDAADSISGKTGLSPTVTLSKDGAAFGAAGGTVTEIGNGWYYLSANTTDTNTLGGLILHATATGADAWDECHQVLVDIPGGAVASVTGNVGGNVVGSVASVTAAVDISAAAVSLIWNKATSALSTAGSIGKLLVDNVDAAISSRSTLTAANVWDRLTSALTTSGSIGKLLVDNIDATISSRSTLTAANVWDRLTSALTTVGSVGKLVVDNLNATISSRAIAGDAMTLTTGERDAVAVEVESHLLDEGDGQMLLNAIVGAIGNTNVDEVALVASIRADMERSGGYLKLIKDKTDNLPSNTASEFSTLNTKIDAIDDYVDTEVAAIKAKTDNLPASPASTSDVTSARDAIQADIADVETAIDAITTIHGQPIRNAAFRMTFRMYTSAGIPATSLTDLIVKFSTDGTGLVQTSNDPVELTDGWYYIDLIAAEMDGKLIALDYSATGAAPSWDKFTTEDAT